MPRADTLDRQELNDRLDRIEHKLQREVATKADLERFATREDLERFATKEDLERFATKEDLERFATKADLEHFATKKDLERSAAKEDLAGFATTVELRTGLDELRHVFEVMMETHRDWFRVLAEGQSAIIQRLDAMEARAVAHERRTDGHDLRLLRLESHTGLERPDPPSRPPRRRR